MHHPIQRKTQIGFTLIELMVTVAIIAILAAIAVPSYRQYIKRNAESQTKAAMQDIAAQLAGWRSKTLSYSGFKPVNQNCTPATDTNCYSTGSSVYIPLGSTAANYRYSVAIQDSSGAGYDTASADGKTWKLTATPNPNGILSGMDKIHLDNTGVRCTYSTTVGSCGATGANQW